MRLTNRKCKKKNLLRNLVMHEHLSVHPIAGECLVLASDGLACADTSLGVEQTSHNLQPTMVTVWSLLDNVNLK